MKSKFIRTKPNSRIRKFRARNRYLRQPRSRPDALSLDKWELKVLLLRWRTLKSARQYRKMRTFYSHLSRLSCLLAVYACVTYGCCFAVFTNVLYCELIHLNYSKVCIQHLSCFKLHTLCIQRKNDFSVWTHCKCIFNPEEKIQSFSGL